MVPARNTERVPRVENPWLSRNNTGRPQCGWLANRAASRQAENQLPDCPEPSPPYTVAIVTACQDWPHKAKPTRTIPSIPKPTGFQPVAPATGCHHGQSSPSTPATRPVAPSRQNRKTRCPVTQSTFIHQPTHVWLPKEALHGGPSMMNGGQRGVFRLFSYLEMAQKPFLDFL